MDGSQVPTSAERLHLLQRTLLCVMPVAAYYATSSDSAARHARASMKRSDPTRPFHVTLSRQTGQLLEILQNVSTGPKQANDTELHQASLQVLDVLEKSFLPAFGHQGYGSLHHRLKGIGGPAVQRRKTRDYSKLKAWSSLELSVQKERLQWLVANSRFGQPENASRDKLLEALDRLLSVVQARAPRARIVLEDVEFLPINSQQQLTWSRYRELCKDLEQVHKQLSDGWICNCHSPHKTALFGVNDTHVSADDPLSLRMLHHTGSTVAWKQISVHLAIQKHSTGHLSYEHLCNHLDGPTQRTAAYSVDSSSTCGPPFHLADLCVATELRPLPQHRLCLVAVLAHLYLNLGGGAWWPYSRVQDSFRLHADFQMANVNVRGVLFPFSLSENLSSDKRAEMLNPGMPNLAEFGKLVLEIVTWRSCSWDSKDFGDQLASLQTRNIDVAFAPLIVDVIEACVGDGRLFSAEKSKSIRGNERMRMRFIDLVIRPLEYVLLEAYGVSADIVFPRAGSISRDPPQREHEANAAKHGQAMMAGVCQVIGSHSSGRDVPHERKAATSFDPISTPPKQTQEEQYKVANPSVTGLTTSNCNIEMTEPSLARAATQWMEKLKALQHLLPELSSRPVKIAVLDTGLHFHRDVPGQYQDNAKCYCFLTDGVPEQYVDQDGHGTHMVSIILDVAPNSTVYAARICETRAEVSGVNASSASTAKRIAKAIRHAVDSWEVDVISMSFGFTKQYRVIREAVDHAHSMGKLMFGAAGNQGSLESLKYPARDKRVIGIYASTGYGSAVRENPSAQENEHNFTFMGTAVEGYISGSAEPQRRSGSSQATAIAAGVAALVLQIIRDLETEALGFLPSHLYAETLRQLGQSDLMKSVFQAMCTRNGNGNYDDVQPWRLIPEWCRKPSERFHAFHFFVMKIVELVDQEHES